MEHVKNIDFRELEIRVASNPEKEEKRVDKAFRPVVLYGSKENKE